MNDIVRLEFGLDQADAVVDGLDVASRLAMGQIDEIANLVRCDAIMVRDERAEAGHRRATVEEIEAIEEHARSIARILGHPSGHFGIGGRGVGPAARRQYEVKKALEAAVAHHRQPGGMTNRHDGVTVRYTQDPLPTATIVDQAA